MRAIDADALIEQTDDKYTFGDIGRYEHDSIVNALNFAPTIEPERKTQWIPCSERLPEADERVLVTTDGYDYYVWDCMPNRGDNYFWEDESGFYHDKHEVIAWMPLPAPYQGEGDSNDRQM